MAVLSALLVASAPIQAVPAPPSPAPSAVPPWRQELDAAELAEAAAAHLPDDRHEDAADGERRLDELFRRLAVENAGQAAVRKAAGDHFWRRGETLIAESEWRAAQALDPNDAQLASALGSAALHDGRPGDARDQLQRAVNARPGSARYRYDLATVLYLFRHQLVGAGGPASENDVIAQAMAGYHQACVLAPNSLEYARGYAETFYGLPAPAWADALAAWEHVRALTVNDPDFATSHLARISLRLGRLDDAETYLACIHDPAFDQVKASLSRQAAAMKRRPPCASAK